MVEDLTEVSFPPAWLPAMFELVVVLSAGCLGNKGEQSSSAGPQWTKYPAKKKTFVVTSC